MSLSKESDPAYTAVCSDATICSNPKGFFKAFAEEVVTLAEEDSWLGDVFGKIQGDAAKLVALSENEQVSDAIKDVLSRVTALYRGKNARESQERRNEASKCLAEGDLNKGLALASQAVLRAPLPGEDDFIDGGVSLALALWLRSEILMRMDKYSLALEDLKMTLKERLPVKMRALYYWRMGNCYKGLGEAMRAKVSYELADRLLVDDEARKKLNEDILSQKDLTNTSTPLCNKQVTSLTGGHKLNMPSLSKLVKITEEENKGRFAVANTDVKTGDVLLIEAPYAACLLSDCYGTHCLHCFKRLEAPIWCAKCSGVAFCSQQCRDEASATYHTTECQFLDLFIGSGMSILSHVALRMVSQAGLEVSLSIHSKYLTNDVKTVDTSAVNDIEGVSRKSKVKTRKEKLNRSRKSAKKNKSEETRENDDNQANEISFREKLELSGAQIYSLCTHSDQRKSSDYLKRIVMAMFLTQCLKKGGFFGNIEEDSKKSEKCITELLCRNLQLLQFNAHEIYETMRAGHKFSGARSRHVAVGIYPTGALFNHECYPAVARYFEGKNIVLRAIRPLSPGEVVAENYGPHFLMKNREERQRALSCRYWFSCQCVACTEQWPNLKQMKTDSTILVRCSNDACKNKFRGDVKVYPEKCSKCSHAIQPNIVSERMENIAKCVKDYQVGARFMEQENPCEAIKVLCAAVDRFSQCGAPPHRETHLAQEALRSCFADYGNIHIVTSTNESSN